MQSEKMKKSRKKLSEADNFRLFRAKEVLTFTLVYLDAAISQTTTTSALEGKCDLKTRLFDLAARLNVLRSTFRSMLNKTEKKLGAIDPALAKSFRQAIKNERKIVKGAKK